MGRGGSTYPTPHAHPQPDTRVWGGWATLVSRLFQLGMGIPILLLPFQLGKEDNCSLLLQPGVSLPAWELYDYVHLQPGDLPVKIQYTLLDKK